METTNDTTPTENEATFLARIEKQLQDDKDRFELSDVKRLYDLASLTYDENLLGVAAFGDTVYLYPGVAMSLIHRARSVSDEIDSMFSTLLYDPK